MVDWIANGESGASVRAKLNTIPASLLAAGLTVGTSAIASGTTGRVLYDNAGVVGETAGITFPGTGLLAMASGTITASAPALDISQTWNNGAVNFTGIKANFTVTASANAGFLLDIQRGGSSQFTIDEFGSVRIAGPTVFGGINNSTAYAGGTAGNAGLSIASTNTIGFVPSSNVFVAPDTALTRAAAATLQLGLADAAAPVAQTLTAQSVVAGTSNTNGADFTIAGSKGTGTGTGGNILFQTANTGSTGTTQNATGLSLKVGSNFTGFYLPANSSGRRGWALEGDGGLALKLRRWSDNFGTALSAIWEVNGSITTDTFQIDCDSMGFSTVAGIFFFGTDLFLTRGAAATLQFGKADAAAPIAQTIQTQSVVAGTSNTAGADWTIAGSKGTGTGAGGSIIFKTSPAGGSGTSQNAGVQVMAITGPGVIQGADSNSTLTMSGGFLTWRSFGSSAFQAGASSFTFGTSDNTQLVFNTSSVQTYLIAVTSDILQQGAGDAAAPRAQTLRVQSVVAGTTDTAGTDWTQIASKGTGIGAGGNLINQTAFSAKSTGSGQGTTVDRNILVAKGKVLTSAAAFSMFDVALPTLTMCGGVIEATIVCTNGTDMQSFTQTVTYSAVNKGGVYTTSITPSTGDKSVSSGTLTTSWTIVSGTNKVTIKVTPTTSLTPSTNAFLLYYTVRNNSEQATTIL